MSGGANGAVLESDGAGLACAAGGFHIDPWRPVATAVITHAHGDHARPGSGRYYCALEGLEIARRRLAGAEIIGVPYGAAFELGAARVSFHPAGHVRGSAQVRVETAGGVWVAGGDYKRAADPTCAAFEVVACDVFITEATFALPIYRWDAAEVVRGQIAAWWERNREAGRVSVLFCYALGKAQRVLAELTRVEGLKERRVFVHGAVTPLIEAYRSAGVEMLPTWTVSEVSSTVRASVRAEAFRGALVIAPPSAAGSPWMRRLGKVQDVDTALASGWMAVRGIRRRRGYDRGFVLSDHADWPDLIRTVRETGARKVLATHGYSDVLARHLRGEGIEAEVLKTAFATDEEE